MLAALAVLWLSACSGGSTDQEHINSFDVNYALAADGTVHAIETISYDFAGVRDRHGIDRYLFSRFAMPDGNDRVYRYENISVRSTTGASALFSTTLGNTLQIRVGNQNATVSGTQVYVLSYDIVGSLNSAQQADGSFLDEFFWSVTGSNWKVPIAKTSVEVHGPADVTKVACFAGSAGAQTPCASASSSGSNASFTSGRSSLVNN